MYYIAIPSHKRSDVIQKRTIAFLEKHNIDKSKVFIFVEPEEIEVYEKALPCYTICNGAKGIAGQRMAISRYFDEDDLIVSMDDDLQEIYRDKTPITDLDLFLVSTFNKMINKNLTLAGIYPTNNPYFFKEKDTSDLRFCIGQLKMFINKRHVELREYNLLEDYENTIKHYNYSGGVLRLNNIGLKCNYNTLKGGLKEYRNDERKIEEVNKFKEQYSSYCSIKKSGKDILLNRRLKNEVISTLWIGESLNELSEMCMLSWLKNGYNIDLYIDKSKDFIIPGIISLNFRDRVKLLDYKEIAMPPHLDTDNILPFSDLWRYRMLFFKGGTWLDADMFLLRRLPRDETIISSEHTFQSGAFRSKLPYVPNIGVLRFKKDDPLLATVVYKIEKKLAKKKKIAKICDNMKVFREEVKKQTSNYPISAVSDYCALDWWNTKEMYYNEIYKNKFNVEPYSNRDILEISYGLHMWNNFTYNKHKIEFSKVHDNSLFNILRRRVY